MASESAPFTSANIVRWLPHLWRTILFPGHADTARPTNTLAALFLIALGAVVVFPRLDFLLFEPDEGRYAQIPKEMLARGDWLTPVLQGEPYLDKPPLFYWLVMIAYRVLGPADWVARLIPATAIVGCVAAVYLLGKRLVGERPAFWGALILALTPGLASMGRILVLDGLLTLWTTIALLTIFEAVRDQHLKRGWWFAAGLALGLGTMTKGPIALLLVLPPLIAHRWLTSSPTRITWRAWLGLFAIVAAINLPWYIAISLRRPEFASYFLWKHNVQRFLTPFDHEQPLWYFGPVLILGVAPVAWMLPLVGRFLISERPSAVGGRTAELGYLLLAATWCVVFFSLSGSKLPTYIMPAFPPLALALGAYAVSVRWPESRLFVAGCALWGVLLILGHAFALPQVARERSPMNHPLEARPFLNDPSIPIYCYPRSVDSVAFYTGRSDFQTYRSKDLAEMLQSMDKNPRSVILFAHRNSKQILTHNVPPHFRVVYVGKLGLNDMAVIDRPK